MNDCLIAATSLSLNIREISDISIESLVTLSPEDRLER